MRRVQFWRKGRGGGRGCFGARGVGGWVGGRKVRISAEGTSLEDEGDEVWKLKSGGAMCQLCII